MPQIWITNANEQVEEEETEREGFNKEDLPASLPAKVIGTDVSSDNNTL